jgi:hypothetical protein
MKSFEEGRKLGGNPSFSLNFRLLLFCLQNGLKTILAGLLKTYLGRYSDCSLVKISTF